MRGSSFWNVTVPRALSLYAFVTFVMLWIGFAIALVGNCDWLDLLWAWVQTQPFVAEILIWLLFLPIMVGLWIWESSWPTPINLLALVGMIVWTLLGVSSFLHVGRGKPG